MRVRDRDDLQMLTPPTTEELEVAETEIKRLRAVLERWLDLAEVEIKRLRLVYNAAKALDEWAGRFNEVTSDKEEYDCELARREQALTAALQTAERNNTSSGAGRLDGPLCGR